MAVYPGFIGPAYRSRSKIAADDILVNLFVEKVESGTGKAPYVLYSTPGFVQYCDLGTSDPVRGQFSLNGAVFAVAGETLYQLPFVSGGSPVTLATGLNNPDDSIVSMAGNGDGGFQIVIASAGSLWCYDIRANTLTAITTVSGTAVVFQDGYFVALDPTTSNIYVSALEDGSSWDPLDVAQRSDLPDKWQTLITSHGELWLPGAQTGSVYSDTGGDFPFTPNQSGKLQYGVVAPNTANLVDGDTIWLAQNAAGGGLVVRGQGYQMQRVSNHALEYALSTYSTISDADAFVYQLQGHTFYALNFPTADKTWVYDATEGQWHQWGPWGGNDFAVCRARTYAFGFGAQLVGDREDGVIWQLSPTTYTEMDGSGIRRRRRAPHLSDENRIAAFDRLWLDAEVGIGLQSGQGSDPMGMLSWSNDGGQTFGTVYEAPFGPAGAFLTRAIWGPCGAGRDRVFQFDYSEPTPLILINAYIRTRPGPGPV